MGSNSAAVSLPWWKALVAAVVCVAVGVAGTVALSGGGGAPADTPSPLSALEGLRSSTVAAEMVTHEAPLSAVTGSPQPTENDADRGVSVGEVAVVDFAAGTASVLPVAPTGDGPPAPAPEGLGDTPVLSVSERGQRTLARWKALWGSFELGDISDTWELTDPLPVGVDATASTVPALFDLVDNAEDWSGELTDAGAGVWRGTLDVSAIEALNDDRVAALDADLAAVVRADLDAEARVPPSGPWELTVSDGAVTALRVEFVAGERIFTVSWFFTPTEERPELLEGDDAVPYAAFRSALDAALAPAGEVFDDGAVAFPGDTDDLTDDTAGEIVLPEGARDDLPDATSNLRPDGGD